MRAFISVDIEGVAGVSDAIQGQRGNSEYEYARRLMTDEASAAIRGAFSGGASEVTVADSHGQMRNLLVDELDPRARVVSGAPRPHGMVQGIDASFDALVLVGYHAAAGNHGTLAHTYNGSAIKQLKLNGKIVGETELFAGYAAEIGVPLFAVSGDDKLAEEVRTSFPKAMPIVVKESIGALAASSLSPSMSCQLIERSVAEAVSSEPSPAARMPSDLPLSITIELTIQVYADVVALLPFVERRGANDVSWTSKSYEEAIRLLQVVSYLAKGVS